MTDLLVRAVIAAPIVVVLPPALGDRWAGRSRRIVLGLILMVAALAPHLGEWRAWGAIAVTLGVGAVPSRPDSRRPSVMGVTALVTAVLVAALVDQGRARSALDHVSDTRAVTIVVAGLLVSVFVGGAVIGSLLAPLADRLRGAPHPGVENAGRVIGWLERALLYGLILVGSPDAAAIVLAAKSVARFPAFSDERFAEYYLIGTLLSFLTAAAVGVAVRALLGLHPLLSTSP